MKRKNFLDKIEVKSPCNESWDEMTGNDEVRFCSHCAKDVHNISAMNRADAEKLVKKSNGKLCVRYVKTSEGNLITAPPKLTQITRRATIAAGILATSLALSTLTYAQGEPIDRRDNSTKTKQDKSAKSETKQGLATISGTVTDANDAVIVGAKVSIFNLKTKELRIVLTGEEGNFEFKGVEPNIYEIQAESSGFKKLILQKVEVLKDVKLEKHLVLEVGAIMGYFVIVEKPTIKTEDKPLISLPITYRDTSKLLKLKPLVPKDKKKKQKN